MAHRTRVETAACFRADIARLLRCVADLSEAQQQSIIYGDWTIKEVLAHIAAWDRELVGGLDELLAGRRPAFAGYREAVFNARAAAASRGLPFLSVLDELRHAHEALVGRIEALTDEEWQRSSPHRWGSRAVMTAASLFGYTYRGETHYGGHAQEIEEWTGKRS